MAPFRVCVFFFLAAVGLRHLDAPCSMFIVKKNLPPPSSPCVSSKRLRVSVQNASVCTGKNARLNRHTETFGTYTRGVFRVPSRATAHTHEQHTTHTHDTYTRHIHTTHTHTQTHTHTTLTPHTTHHTTHNTQHTPHTTHHTPHHTPHTTHHTPHTTHHTRHTTQDTTQHTTQHTTQRPRALRRQIAGVFASRCRVVVDFSLLVVLTIRFGTV